MTPYDKAKALFLANKPLRAVVKNLQSQIEVNKKKMLEALAEGYNADHPDREDGPVAAGDLYSSGWKCRLSPIGRCVYDEASRVGGDSCLFCGLPEERL